jgi:hypothetical protein
MWAVKPSRLAVVLVLCAAFGCNVLAETAKRLIVIKIDGLPADFLERHIDSKEPDGGRYLLPWFHHIFVERGTWIENFYVRGISLSTPSWSMLESGQHLAIRGNAEFDRYYGRVYDYLNFFPFYVGYARSRRADMPAVEVIDESGIPLFADQFPFANRYQSMELFQRGVHWRTLSETLKSRIAAPVKEVIDEWQKGFEFGDAILEQQERELIAKLADPEILYLDYFSGEFDHTAHLTNDESAQLNQLRRIDAMLGRVWKANGSSPLANETVLALISDHGLNSIPGVYSQGYDLVRFFNSADGGGHHVITNRHPRGEYKLRGLDPLVSWVETPSQESTYLAGDKEYPTALLDLDGNERTSVQLRNSDLNEIQILLEQLARPTVEKAKKNAEAAAILAIVERNRAVWSRTAEQLREEMAALERAIGNQQALVAADRHAWSAEDRASGTRLEAMRRAATLGEWQGEQRGYSEYLSALDRLLSLKAQDLVPPRVRGDTLIPKRVMGEPNSMGQLARYVSGPASEGMVFNEDGSVDEERSFSRIDYFSALASVHVRNSVQASLGSAPVDFIAVRVPKQALEHVLEEPDQPDFDAIFLYRDSDHEALLLNQHRNGELRLRYVPVSGAVQDRGGELHFSRADWGAEMPLKLFEDPGLQVVCDRSTWLNAWHSEREWLNATHRAKYSNGVIGLAEYFRHWEPDSLAPLLRAAANQQDCPLLRRFTARRRAAVEPDMLILANYGWNFNVRNPNPGGNHGSFFRISTHSVFMLAGAGVAAGLRVEQPYDSLNFVPTLAALLGRPVESYPAPPVWEVVTGASRTSLSTSK